MTWTVYSLCDWFGNSTLHRCEEHTHEQERAQRYRVENTGLPVLDGSALSRYTVAMRNQSTSLTLCQCGRPERPTHCRNCGSTNLYGLVQATVVLEHEGQAIKVPGFRCRRCGTAFSEAQPCEAPFFESRSMAEHRKLDTAREAVGKAIEAAGGKSEYIKQLLEKRRADTEPKQ